MRPSFFVLCGVIAVAGWAGAVQAQTVFRCVEDRTGKISYSNVPCHGTNSGREISVRENSLDTSGAREQALRRELNDLRSRVQAMEQAPAAPAPVANRMDSEECRQARRSYDIEAGSMTQTKSTVEAKRSAMYGACGMREPDRVEITNIEVNNAPSRSPIPSSGPSRITNCSGSGCRDDAGGRYDRLSGDLYRGPDGQRCRSVGNRMECH